MTDLALCAAYRCMFNENGLCSKPYLTLDEAGKCDFIERQEPLPEPSK